MFLTTARRVLLGVTLGVILALIVAPQTRWIAAQQMQDTVRFGAMPGYDCNSGYSAAQLARMQTVSAQHPQDYQLQYAEAILGNPSAATDGAERLRQLEARFPNNPSLWANILRLACLHEVHLWYRPEEYLLFQDPIPKQPWHLPKTTPAQFAAFDRNAEVGEQIDPNNAFFPMMRAAALYAAHRDAAARAALLQISHCTRWNDYSSDEVAAMTRMHQLAFGDKSAVWKALSGVDLLLPHYAMLRQMTYVATYQAMQEERQGHGAQAVSLRMALIHGSGLMRIGAAPLIGAIVAVAMNQAAMQRPGGAPCILTPASQNGMAFFTMPPPIIAVHYAMYLRAQGDNADAAQVMAVDAADRQAINIINKSVVFSSEGLDISPLVTSSRRLILLWIVDLLFLANVFWLLVLWGTAALLQHRPPDSLPRRHKALLGAGAAILLLVAWLAARKMSADYVDLYFLASASDRGLPQYSETWDAYAPALESLSALLVPLLVLLTGIVSSRWKPVRQTVVGVSAVATCVLMLGYAYYAISTARQEHLVNQTLAQTLQNEGRYVAAQMGQTWPGVVD